MRKKTITKKQHYYPRCLLKYFADDCREVNVYIRKANKLRKMNYESTCFSNYTYESEDTPDNICFDITSLGYYEVLYLCNVSQ